ncbi:hypothetical protein MCOR06_010341 [Pyricularia oryzae]|nr:hypothetical protein MCOR06_010341 [Pyricularia oryzae]
MSYNEKLQKPVTALNSRAGWPKWYRAYRQNAEILRVWKLVDPDQQTYEKLVTLDELTESVTETLKRTKFAAYEAQLKVWDSNST